MSPAGLFSGALGVGVLAAAPPADDQPPPAATSAAAPTPGREPQPAATSAAAATPARRTRRAGEDRAREIMRATVGTLCHRPVPARSTPGQTCGQRSDDPYADDR